MKTQLIPGVFDSKDSLLLIIQMMHAKIKYHENKINKNSNEGDMNNRESKMKRLQKELLELLANMSSQIKNVKTNAVIKIN